MVVDNDWAQIRRQEEILLARCEKVVFGDPDSPGGGLKDILYFTPCKRWLRICVYDAYLDVHPICQDLFERTFLLKGMHDRDGERSSILNGTTSTYYISLYNFIDPPYLDDSPYKRELEVSVYMEGLCKLIEAEKYVESNNSTLSDKIRSNLNETLDCEFPRNSLLAVLQYYSQNWPATIGGVNDVQQRPPQDIPAALPLSVPTQDQLAFGKWSRELQNTEKSILLALAKNSGRQTKAAILRILEVGDFACSKNTVTKYLDMLLRKTEGGRPELVRTFEKEHGVSLTPEGSAFAKYLLGANSDQEES